MTEAEARIRAALMNEALFDEGASVGDTLAACDTFNDATTPENIVALLADRDEREARLQAEIKKLHTELAHEEQRVADMMADVNRQ